MDDQKSTSTHARTDAERTRTAQEGERSIARRAFVGRAFVGRAYVGRGYIVRRSKAAASGED